MSSKAKSSEPTSAAPNLTPDSLQLFLDYGRDAGNWSGTPMVGGNVGGSKQDAGNLTDLKRKKLLTTFVEERNEFISFTEKGKALLGTYGINLRD